MVGKLDLRHFSRRRSVAAQQLQRVVDVHRRKSTPCRRSNRGGTPRASQRPPPTRQPHVPPLHSTGPVATNSALIHTKRRSKRALARSCTGAAQLCPNLPGPEPLRLSPVTDPKRCLHPWF